MFDNHSGNDSKGEESRVKMKRKLILIMATAMLVLSACASAKTADSVSKSGGMTGAAPVEAPAAQSPAAEYEMARDQASLTTSNTTSTSVERLVIKNANLSIIVVDPAKSMDAISQMASDMGGYVVSSNLYKITTDQGQEIPQAQITIRVPSEKLDEALTKIKAQTKDPTKDVQSENSSGQDVTDQYTDLQSRLRNLEDAEAQLREIMASATKTEDVLSVFNQLTSIREQIEVLKGQIKYYEESAALSAINVDLVAEASIKPLTIAGWQPVGVARDAAQALIKGLQVVVNVVIWLVIFALPIGLVICLPIWLIVRAMRKRRARRKAQEITTPPAV